MKRWLIIVTRLLGVTLLIWACYAHFYDIDYTSSYDIYNGGRKQTKTLTLDYLKIGIGGIIALFYREIKMYLT